MNILLIEITISLGYYSRISICLQVLWVLSLNCDHPVFLASRYVTVVYSAGPNPYLSIVHCTLCIIVLCSMVVGRNCRYYAWVSEKDHCHVKCVYSTAVEIIWCKFSLSLPRDQGSTELVHIIFWQQYISTAAKLCSFIAASMQEVWEKEVKLVY